MLRYEAHYTICRKSLTAVSFLGIIRGRKTPLSQTTKESEMKQAPKKDKITAAGDKLRATVAKAKPMIEKGAAKVQKAFPAISNKQKEKAAADAKKAKMKPEPKKKK
jgi:hypothetical protein